MEMIHTDNVLYEVQGEAEEKGEYGALIQQHIWIVALLWMKLALDSLK
jgi:hypothetical protein